MPTGLPINPTVLLALTTAGCTTSSVTPDTEDTEDALSPPPLELVFSWPPLDIPDGALFAADVTYDRHEQTAFDILLPDEAEPTPLLIFIHGGGFRGGDKSSIYSSSDIAVVLGAGVGFATVNYRLLEEVDTDGVLKPLENSRRALQFIRYHHETLNIDTEQVFLCGGSAGAGTALWLGSHDDMADPDADDWTARESTRVKASGILETQATYDIFDWEIIFGSYGLTIDDMDDFVGEESLLSFYGVSSWSELESDAVSDYRARVDMLEMLDSSDASVWIASVNQLETEPTDAGVLYHHPYHARAVMERAQAVGLEEVSDIPQLGIGDEGGEDMLQFFRRHLDD